MVVFIDFQFSDFFANPDLHPWMYRSASSLWYLRSLIEPVMDMGPATMSDVMNKARDSQIHALPRTAWDIWPSTVDLFDMGSAPVSSDTCEKRSKMANSKVKGTLSKTNKPTLPVPYLSASYIGTTPRHMSREKDPPPLFNRTPFWFLHNLCIWFVFGATSFSFFSWYWFYSSKVLIFWF